MGEDGKYLPFPIEYKRGSARGDNANELQLCAQAICLEEMLVCEIPRGALFYGETRRRQTVEFTPELREEVRSCVAEMRELYTRGSTPKVKPKKGCSACSLKEICIPVLLKDRNATAYLRDRLEERE